MDLVKNKKRQQSIMGIIAGVLVIGYVLVTCGMTLFFPQEITTIEQGEEVFAASDGLYRPYCTFNFTQVAPSDLYMYLETDTSEKPTDWVMYGEMEDRLITFILSAASDATAENYPAVEHNVSYVLRYPSDNAEYISNIGTELRSIAAKDGITGEMYDMICADVVFEASRTDRIVNQLLLVAGLLAIAIFAVRLLVMKNKVDDATDEFEVLETFGGDGVPAIPYAPQDVTEGVATAATDGYDSADTSTSVYADVDVVDDVDVTDVDVVEETEEDWIDDDDADWEDEE